MIVKIQIVYLNTYVIINTQGKTFDSSSIIKKNVDTHDL